MGDVRHGERSGAEILGRDSLWRRVLETFRGDLKTGLEALLVWCGAPILRRDSPAGSTRSRGSGGGDSGERAGWPGGSESRSSAGGGGGRSSRRTAPLARRARTRPPGHTVRPPRGGSDPRAYPVSRVRSSSTVRCAPRLRRARALISLDLLTRGCVGLAPPLRPAAFAPRSLVRNRAAHGCDARAAHPRSPSATVQVATWRVRLASGEDLLREMSTNF